MLSVLTGAIEARDPYTRGHSARVTALAEEVALRLGWSEERLASLRIGGPLHDIGKLAVSDEVLRKEGRLDDERAGPDPRAPEDRRADPAAAWPALREAIPYVLYHHERWDGDGYPSGKAGEEIPIEARVLADRRRLRRDDERPALPPALTRDEALAEVERCAGTQFDPEIARVFLELFAEAELPAAAAS